MKTFVHPFAVKVSEEDVVLNKAFPLVRELAHKYGLSVITLSARIDRTLDLLYLSRQDGIPICKVFFMEEKESFAIRNCMAEKDRGRHHEDKLTFFGKRVSFVMKTIEKEALIPKDAETFFRSTTIANGINEAVTSLSASYGEARKGNNISGEIMHDLIEIAFGNRHVSTLSSESMDKVQSALDKYRETDKTRVERQRELNEIFSNPMWAILYDETDSFCVGKMKLSPTWNSLYDSRTSSVDMDIVEDFRRVADVTEITELIPTMAMLKTSIEQARPDIKYEFVGDSKFYPINWTGVSPSLRVMVVNCGDRWNSNMLLKPKMIMVAI